MTEITEAKKQLRRQIREKLGKLDEGVIEEQSRAVTRKVLQLPEYQNATSVGIFLSMPGREISTTEIVADALQAGKKVFIPYIHAEQDKPKTKIMDMLRLVDQPDLHNLKPDAWGIPSLQADGIEDRENALGGKGISDSEPTPRNSAKLDVVFMPGMAFDTSGNRLGHGKGFYDRYLSRVSQVTGMNRSEGFPRLVALALREQLLTPGEAVPVTQSDWKIDHLVIPD